jgi:hypothetical protein
MAKLPTSVNVPTANVRRDPGVRVPQTSGTAAGFIAAGQALNDATNRIQNRTDTVNIVRSVNEYKTFANSELRRLTTEEDFSDPNVSKTFGEKIQEQQRNILENWSGSPDAKAKLTASLENVQAGAIDTAAVEHLMAGRKLVDQQVMSSVRGFADAAYKDPSQLPAIMNEFDASLSDLAPAMTEDGLLVAREAGRQELAKSTATALLDRGDIDGVEKILSIPGVLESLDAGTARQIRTRVATQRQALAKADQAGLAKLREFEQITGRAPTAQERLKLAGVGGSNAVTLSDKVGQFESVIGRPATEEEVQKMAGADVDPGGFSFGKGMSGVALANLTNGSEGFARGMMTPEEERNFESSVVAFMTPQRDPDTGSITQPILPPHVDDALKQRGYRWDINNGALIRPGGETMADRARQGMNSAAASDLPTELQSSNPDQTVWNMADKVTGVGPAVIDAAGRIPEIGENLGNAEITQAKTYVTNLSRDLIKVLQNNPRYAEGERQAIENEVSIDGSVFDNPTAYRNRLIGLDEALQKRAQFAFKTANNPNVGREERIGAMNILNAVVNFRQNLGVPPRISTAQEWESIPEGQQYVDPNGVIRTKGPANAE